MQNGPPTGHLQHYASRGHPACPLRYTLRLEDYCMHDCGKMSQYASPVGDGKHNLRERSAKTVQARTHKDEKKMHILC